MSDKKHPIKELDNKILAAQCLIEMVGSELLELYGKDPKIKNTYQNLFSAVQSLKESKKNLPVDI